MYDPSLLYNPTKTAATTHCTDDMQSALPKSLEHEKAKVTNRFKCREAQRPPIDFKGLDISCKGRNVTVSKMAYLKTITISDDFSATTKPELQRPMKDKEISHLRSDAGKLFWVATVTSPLSSFHASVALLRNRERTLLLLQLLLDTRKALPETKQNELAKLRLMSLEEESIHIRLYSDASFQKLFTKHSQIGFIVSLSDSTDAFNLIHWDSSRSPCRAHSTVDSELMALDFAFRCIKNLRMIVFQLFKK